MNDRTAKGPALLETAVFLRDLSREPLLITRAEGVYLYDDDGGRYLDAASGAAVACLGHGNHEIAGVLEAQARKVAYAHPSRFVTEAAIDLAEKLVERAPPGITRVLFTSGGSESVEAAMKLARQAHLARGRSGRYKVISRRTSYHGATLGALSISGQVGRREPFAPMMLAEPMIAPAYPYRCGFCRQAGACTLECADDLERAILSEGADTVAAFVAEPIVGSSVPGSFGSADYWRRVREVCDRHGVLLVADEVMSGNGRSGRWWAMQHTGVVPDMIATAKGVGAGYTALGALLVTEDLHQAMRESGGGFRHGHTYSANPLSCAVGSKVIDIIERDGLLANVAATGRLLLERLRGALGDHPHVGEVRGRGLLLGVEFVRDKATRAPFDLDEGVQSRLAHACLRRGLYLYPGGGSADGVRGDHVLLAPPFILDASHVEEIVGALSAAVGEVLA